MDHRHRMVQASAIIDKSRCVVECLDDGSTDEWRVFGSSCAVLVLAKDDGVGNEYVLLSDFGTYLSHRKKDHRGHNLRIRTFYVHMDNVSGCRFAKIQSWRVVWCIQPPHYQLKSVQLGRKLKLSSLTGPSQKAESMDQEAQCRLAFETFDTDHDGFINEKEFRELVMFPDLQSIKSPLLTDAEIRKFLKEIDSNDDGRISYDEFLKWWNKQPTTPESEQKQHIRDNLHRTNSWLKKWTQFGGS